MGPYCKFCGDRCFVPTSSDDLIKTDLKATCTLGIEFDLDCTFPRLFNSDKSKKLGWIQHLSRGDKYATALQLLNGKVYEYEIMISDLTEIIDFTAPPKLNTYYTAR